MTKPQSPELLETLELICKSQDLEVADVARALGVQPGSFRRCMASNPTAKMLKRVGWALGMKWYWIGVPPEDITLYIGTAILFEVEAPAFIEKTRKAELRQDRKAGIARASRRRPAPARDELVGQYPAKAMKDEVVDTRYMPNEPALPPQEINPSKWEGKRAELGTGLPAHLVMSDKAVEAGFSFAQYTRMDWTLEALSAEGLIVDSYSVGAE